MGKANRALSNTSASSTAATGSKTAWDIGLRYTRYVGRVGLLAVALGFGAMAASTPVVVLADTNDGSESPSASTSEVPEGEAAQAR